MARRATTTPATISRLETGQTAQLRPPLLHRIAHALGTEPATLLAARPDDPKALATALGIEGRR